MKYWLFKSEPNTWSWNDQIKKGEKGEHWDGVRNYQAAKNMKSMRLKDQGFFYHSVKEKQIVGIVEVIKEYYPDYTDPKGIFGMVDIKAIKTVKKIVSLKEIKENSDLKEMQLVKQNRLSVSPVTKSEWEIILKMCETQL
tara:strand:+ start:310 stop:729 length:420 start_codon:yes stop_codon:yes gene_type:complete